MKKISPPWHRHNARITFLYDIFSMAGRCFFLLMLLGLSSCYTSKGVNYLQTNSDKFSTLVRPTVYTIQPNDVLSVKVQSRDPDQSAFFNTTSIENQNFQANPASLFLNGYTVDSGGMINLAIVGELKVSDLSVEEIRNLVQAEVNKYLLNAIVSVKLTSFKISVLGDVKNPGTNYVYNAQSTIFEALAAAGDLNLTANRKTVKLVRQVGEKSIVRNLDLTSPYIIQSEYYFLHPNDVIYVEPSSPNLVRNNLSIATVILSAISTGLLIYNIAN